MTLKCRYILIIFIAFLTACGTTPQSAEMTKVQNTALAMARTGVVLSQTAMPTATLPFPTFSHTPTPLPKFSLDNLRMAYIVDGNVYIQNGSSQPIKLTNSREDSSPIFSDDGEKIVFYRGKLNDNNNVYSINSNEGLEQELITNDWLAKLGAGTKIGPLMFIPGTHHLLFNTYLCPNENSLVGLFLVDTDTGKIEELLKPALGRYLPWGGNTGWHGNFSVSPDGRLLSVAISGHIDILSIDGKIVRRNIMTYTRSTPIELFPRQYWLPNSNELIISLPTKTNFGRGYEGIPIYTVWRYSLENAIATQIPFEPSPKWTYMECGDIAYPSPNGNWIVYERKESLYVGNLSDGHVQSYALNNIDYCLPILWNTESTHFIYGRYKEKFLGTVNNLPIPIDNIFFLGWVDTNRYIYYIQSKNNNKAERDVLVGELIEKPVLIYESDIFLPKDIDPYSFTFVVLAHKVEK